MSGSGSTNKKKGSRWSWAALHLLPGILAGIMTVLGMTGAMTISPEIKNASFALLMGLCVYFGFGHMPIIGPVMKSMTHALFHGIKRDKVEQVFWHNALIGFLIAAILHGLLAKK